MTLLRVSNLSAGYRPSPAIEEETLSIQAGENIFAYLKGDLS